jgi:hypothetical protein
MRLLHTTIMYLLVGILPVLHQGRIAQTLILCKLLVFVYILDKGTDSLRCYLMELHGWMAWCCGV